MNVKPLVVAVVASLVQWPALAASPVLVDPVRAEVDKNWLYDIKDSRARPGALRESDARDIAAEMARSLQSALDAALREQGVEVATAAGPGVVRLSARIENLRVNAPENQASGVTNLARYAGHATLLAEARDANGAVLLSSELPADAGDTGRLQRASDVSNRFWFDALFRDWSSGVARELKQKAR
jgi:hypothetical protein